MKMFSSRFIVLIGTSISASERYLPRPTSLSQLGAIPHQDLPVRSETKLQSLKPRTELLNTAVEPFSLHRVLGPWSLSWSSKPKVPTLHLPQGDNDSRSAVVLKRHHLPPPHTLCLSRRYLRLVFFLFPIGHPTDNQQAQSKTTI
eukprot:252606-Rhodomonas_salina.1